MVNTKPFWQALIFTLSIFLIGMLLGFYIESSREKEVGFSLYEAETNVLDEQVRAIAGSSFNISCDIAVKKTFEFADKIYNEALALEQYDEASQFNNNFFSLHRRYDLLRMMLWAESVELKESCLGNIHTVVYFYSYKNDELKTKAMQLSLSKELLEVKNKYPDKIILIPIAGNTNLSSVEVVMTNYNITSLPSILVDESRIIEGVVPLDELEKIIFDSNKQ